MLATDEETYIRSVIGRNPTPLEKGAFENLWSEHCSYRSTRKFLKTLPTNGDNVILGPGDDAAIVKFTDNIALSIAMESHNHPSYINPYSGAATGVGGIVRDVFSMGALPIGIMAPGYFGNITGDRTLTIIRNTTAGAADYSNSINVPVLSGYRMFDESFTGNPLINVACLGICRPDKFMLGKATKTGSNLILFGAKTGSDGLGGASFASGDIAKDAADEGVPNTCVDGNPELEIGTIKATLEMFEKGILLACRDLGAAGLCGASSEMCAGIGAKINANSVPLREENMNEIAIMLSESQERMLGEVMPDKVAQAEAICKKFGQQFAVIGETTGNDRYVVEFNGKVVCDVPIKLLAEGAPESDHPQKPYSAEKPFTSPTGSLKELALEVLSHPDLSDNSINAAQFNSQAQGRTISITPFYSVLNLNNTGCSMACGCNARHTFLNPYAGAANSVLELASHIACVGGTPLCVLNNLNFGSPEKPEVMWQLSNSINGLGDMCRALNVPVVGGNVSLHNDSEEYQTSIKPAPVVSMFGRGELIGWEWPETGDKIAIIGTTKEEFGGSVLDAISGCNGNAPEVGDIKAIPIIRDLVERAVLSGCMAITRGGLLYALVCLAAQSDVTIKGDALTQLFSETYGRFLVTFTDETALKEIGLPYEIIGSITGNGTLTINTDNEEIILTQQELFTAGSTLNKACRAR
ncbi:MAG TPA: phosphoribosylformylglycinamidine synthase subunit PurL [Methanocorpusculum sp.]|nr:phosphoribosylformylglycinamidine synthase subunit PurL [Methanocorpusculum sp.]